MTVKRKDIVDPGPLKIDLDGPDGNAFVIIGEARHLMRDLNFSPQKQERIISKMLNGDYLNVLKTMESQFGDYIELNTEQEYILKAFIK